MYDVKKLPRRALCDTGFWIRALGDRPKDPRSPQAEAFFKAMADNGREMLLPAPCLAELIRGKPALTIPSTPSVIVVGFDRIAAMELGKRFPASFIKQQKVKSGYEKGYIQFDAMIVACAIRHNAECIITFDNPMKELDYGPEVQMLFRNVRDFQLPLMASINKSQEAESAAPEDTSQSTERYEELEPGLGVRKLDLS
ncbi:PIN domain-containing protein [Corallococcus sp. AB038B]|uniref:type II toxin-antitoxin system VapC family toxin n=1 Tax=Corallococcus sp. AB038B TaxID=2316718 RepID=UPI001315A6A9|nr:PIN domain-containing protein [Corallococcus sp. AB038B]